MAEQQGGELDDFDPTKEKSTRDPIPKGEYPFVVTKCEMKKSKNGDYDVINAEFQVLKGEFQNRLVFGRFNYKYLGKKPGDNTAKATQIGRGQFSDLCKAVGLLKPSTCSQLVGKKFLGKVKIDKDDTGEHDDKNEMTRFKPFDGAAATAASAPASGPGKEEW